MTSFRRIFHHDGKFSPAWWRWVTPPPLHSICHHVQKLWCMLQLRGQIHSSYFSSTLFSSVGNNARISKSIPPPPQELDSARERGEGWCSWQSPTRLYKYIILQARLEAHKNKINKKCNVCLCWYVFADGSLNRRGCWIGCVTVYHIKTAFESRGPEFFLLLRSRKWEESIPTAYRGPAHQTGGIDSL